jgi:hypothetical protein
LQLTSINVYSLIPEGCDKLKNATFAPGCALSSISDPAVEEDWSERALDRIARGK